MHVIGTYIKQVPVVVEKNTDTIFVLTVLTNATQVYGSGFVNRTGSLLCRFGDNHVVEAFFASSSVVRCEAPARTEPGAVNVAVSVDGGSTFGGEVPSGSDPAAVVHFRYLTPSFVTGISPRSGPDTGGTVVTIRGAGFSSAFRFTCKFQPVLGGTEAEDSAEAAAAEVTAAVETSAVFVSSSELACIAPLVASGDKLGKAVEMAIFVDFGSGVLTRLPSSTALGSGSVTVFTYVPSLQLTQLNPDRGPVAGGTVVYIGGANFLAPLTTGGEVDTTETAWCRFGSTVTMGLRLSDGIIRCSSPPQGVGVPAEVEVSVSVNSGADFQGAPPESPLVSAFRASVWPERYSLRPRSYSSAPISRISYA